MNSFTFMLAPMEDITDPSFRTICHKYGADLTFTEMVRIDPLSRNNAATWSRLDVKDSTPVIIQLLGTNEPRLKKFLKMFKPHEGFEGFNFNLGCPSPQVIKLGQGCAMIKRISKTKKLVNIIHDYGYNCSIKMRLGMNKFEKEKKIYLNLIDAVPAEFFIVHARYGAQTYKEEPDYSVYEECVKTGKNIIANGNITTKEQVENYWYGYYFWTFPDSFHGIFEAAGHGGQEIIVAPNKKLVVVVRAWPYIKDTEWLRDNFVGTIFMDILSACY